MLVRVRVRVRVAVAVRVIAPVRSVGGGGRLREGGIARRRGVWRGKLTCRPRANWISFCIKLMIHD